MICPFCRHDDSRVVDSRPVEDGTQIRRRRECPECGQRFSTQEVEALWVPGATRGHASAFDHHDEICGRIGPGKCAVLAAQVIKRDIDGALHA